MDRFETEPLTADAAMAVHAQSHSDTAYRRRDGRIERAGEFPDCGEGDGAIVAGWVRFVDCGVGNAESLGNSYCGMPAGLNWRQHSFMSPCSG